MKYKHISWFTLIELLVVVSIIAIVLLATYMPYAHHQRKTFVKQAAKELSQTLNESRNLAIHGLDTGSGNVYIGVHLVPWSQKLDYYTANSWLSLSSLPSYTYKTKRLPKWVEIFSINGDTTTQRLISFAPVTGSWQVNGISDEVISIILSYKGSEDPVLQKELKYYRKSFLSDY